MLGDIDDVHDWAARRQAMRDADPRPYFGDPAACWIDGGSREPFRYEPGPDPWIVQYRDGSYMAMTAMVFARDEKHARQIVSDMLDHAAECRARYVESLKDGSYDYDSHVDERMARARNLVLKVCPAPKNQMYKVGWADNDEFGLIS